MRRILLTCLLVACRAGAETTDWGKNPIWDDGLAEVAVYRAERPVYGKTRTYGSVLITVKEDFNAAFHTKADPPYDAKQLIPILKMNRVSEIRTENYPYRYLTSIFVQRENALRLVKMTVGSQEWCGNTFKEVKTWGGKPELIYHSYWDGQGDGSYPLDWGPDVLLEDQLPLSLRGLPFSNGYRMACRLLPTQITNKAEKPKIIPATVRVAGQDEITVPAGAISCWRVDVMFQDAQQTYWFEKDFPNILVRFQSSDGRSLMLEKRERRTYW